LINLTIQALSEGQDLTGKDGILTPLIKKLTEAALNAELVVHLATNRKNGYCFDSSVASI
jgi:putative transposase